MNAGEAIILELENARWVRTQDSGLLPSYPGVYETFALLVNGTTFSVSLLSRHWRRFSSGAIKYQLTIPSFETVLTGLGALKRHIKKDVSSSKQKKYRIRLQCFHDNQKIKTQLVLQPFSSRFPGNTAALQTLPASRAEFAYKHTPATASQSSQEKLAEEFNEALFINDDSEVTETSWCNFYVVTPDDQIATSPEALPGIVREQLLNSYLSLIQVRKIKRSELENPRYAAFITNVLHGIVPVTRIDTTVLSQSALIPRLAQWYQDELHSPKDRIFL